MVKQTPKNRDKNTVDVWLTDPRKAPVRFFALTGIVCRSLACLAAPFVCCLFFIYSLKVCFCHSQVSPILVFFTLFKMLKWWRNERLNTFQLPNSLLNKSRKRFFYLLIAHVWDFSLDCHYLSAAVQQVHVVAVVSVTGSQLSQVHHRVSFCVLSARLYAKQICL